MSQRITAIVADVLMISLVAKFLITLFQPFFNP